MLHSPVLQPSNLTPGIPMISADLHTHTRFSDGHLAPMELVERALEREVSHLAITDHDCVHALYELEEASIPDGLRLIPGVEISCNWPDTGSGREIHIVGLFIDHHEPGLCRLLARQQDLRRERALEIDARLRKNGIHGLSEYLETLPCRALSRNHVADFLIAEGLARDKKQAFKRLLGKQGRYSAASHWCGVATAVEHIRGAGGVAVLAHPDRYRLGRNLFRRLLDDLQEAGGEALEVSYSNLNPDTLHHLATVAQERELWASVGSDFHSPAQHWMDLGRIRQLPTRVAERAIWHHPLWQADRMMTSSG